MKQIILFLLLVPLSCSAFAQTFALKTQATTQTQATAQIQATADRTIEIEESYPFSIGLKAITMTIDTTIANFLSTADEVQTPMQYQVFLEDSGLYSGFGTAWYRKYGLTIDSSDVSDGLFELHCDLFSATFSSIEAALSSQATSELSVGLYNSF